MEWDKLVIAVLAGAGAGVFFFGGLWITVTRAVHTQWPAVWFLLSFVVRSGVTVLVFYHTGAGNWRYLLACLGGFLFIKIFSSFLARPRNPVIHRKE